MIIIAAMVVGAMTSAAWVAPKPFYAPISFVAWLLFLWIRSAK